MRRSTTSSGAASRKPAPTESCRRSAIRWMSEKRDLDQHASDPRTHQRLDRSRLRSGSSGLLLRPSDRDSDAAMDRLRAEAFRHQDARRGADDDPGARLHLAHLVHAMTSAGRYAGALIATVAVAAARPRGRAVITIRRPSAAGCSTGSIPTPSMWERPSGKPRTLVSCRHAPRSRSWTCSPSSAYRQRCEASASAGTRLTR